MAAILIVLLIVSLIIPLVLILFVLALIFVVLGYAVAKNNSLSFDLTENPGEDSLVNLTATGEKAESLLKDLLLRVMIRERATDPATE